MNTTQSEILKRLTQFSRNHGYFCSEFKLSAEKCRFYLEELEELGYIAQIKTGYKLTQAGRNFMDGGGRVVEARYYGNASMTDKYEPPIWNVRAGAGEKSPNGRCA